MALDVRSIIGDAWILVGIIWLACGLTTKPAVRTQSIRSRILHVALLVTAFFLLFSQRSSVGPLAWRFVPNSVEVAYFGLILTLAGIGVGIWARFFLGRNWSGVITVKKDHELVRNGPYSLVRHPMYSGFLLALLGTAIALGEVRCLIGLLLAIVGFRLKSLLEESFMVEQFGSRYAQYRREVKALIPFVW